MQFSICKIYSHSSQIIITETSSKIDKTSNVNRYEGDDSANQIFNKGQNIFEYNI